MGPGVEGGGGGSTKGGKACASASLALTRAHGGHVAAHGGMEAEAETDADVMLSGEGASEVLVLALEMNSLLRVVA
jgi:hypothetical protein